MAISPARHVWPFSKWGCGIFISTFGRHSGVVGEGVPDHSNSLNLSLGRARVALFRLATPLAQVRRLQIVPAFRILLLSVARWLVSISPSSPEVTVATWPGAWHGQVAMESPSNTVQRPALQHGPVKGVVSVSPQDGLLLRSGWGSQNTFVCASVVLSYQPSNQFSCWNSAALAIIASWGKWLGLGSPGGAGSSCQGIQPRGQWLASVMWYEKKDWLPSREHLVQC